MSNRRLFLAILAAMLAVNFLTYGVLSLFANQSNTWSPLIGPVSGLQLTTNYNNAFSALQSCNSGASAPSNDQTASPVVGQCWLNTSTTPYTLQQFDGTTWTAVGWLDNVGHQWIPNIAGGVGSIASNTTTDLCQTGGILTPTAAVTVTGSVTINGFGTTCATGTVKLVAFTGTPLLVNNVTSFILPNAGFNIQTSAGDTLVAMATGSGNWRVVSYQQANGLGGIPSGTEASFAGITAPTGWTLEAGQAISRSSNPNLFNALSLLTTGTPGSGSPTINAVGTDLRNLGVEGAFVEGNGISLGTFISSVTSTTITLSANAVPGGSSGESLRLIPWGQGDGATTFNVPDRRGLVLAGRDNMGGTAASRLTLAQSQGILGTKLGAGAAGGNIGGEQSHTQLLAEIASHTHTLTDPGHTHTGTSNKLGVGSGGGYNGGNAGTLSNDTQAISVNSSTIGIPATNSSGSGTAMNQIQPTGITNYIIKN